MLKIQILIIEYPYYVYTWPICNCYTNRLGVHNPIYKLREETINETS